MDCAKIVRQQTSMNKVILGIIFIVFLIGVFGLALGRTKQTNPPDGKLQIVAAENFYGDVAKQLGGDNVQVTSILSDPNVDPHEYESNVQDGVAISNANIVIENGDGYDTWMDKLLSASPNKNRTVLVGANIAYHKLEDNPHVWYGIDNMQTIAAKIDAILKTDDPSHASEYEQNLATFDRSLQPVQQKMNEIKAKYSNSSVGLTETIYLYQTKPMALNVLTPIAFEQAVAEGNDPSAQDVATTNDQITKREVKVLIYNEQTITPITTNLQNEAKQNNIPVVPVTETMPQTLHYQSWMLSQLNTLEQALASSTFH